MLVLTFLAQNHLWMACPKLNATNVLSVGGRIHVCRRPESAGVRFLGKVLEHSVCDASISSLLYGTHVVTEEMMDMSRLFYKYGPCGTTKMVG